MSTLRNNLVCQCYLTNNYYIEIKGQSYHITYLDEVHLREVTLSKLSLNLTEEEIKQILNELDTEKNRRLKVFCSSQERKQMILDKYVPKLIHVYTFKESYLDKKFLKLVSLCKDPTASNEDVFKSVEVIRGTKDMYRIPVFTQEFCTDLLNELENFKLSDMPKGRPNSMNHYGILLDEVGFYENLINPLRESYLDPVSSRLFFDYLKIPDKNSIDEQESKDEVTNSVKHHKYYSLDSQKAFIVNYKVGEDVDLAPHYDNSEITFNISLDGNVTTAATKNKNNEEIDIALSNFENGEVYFELKVGETALRYISLAHVKGSAIVHRGSLIHGAHPITRGNRSNMVIWARCSKIRNQKCPMCKSMPRLKEIPGIGDGFSI
ncbi:hypothetical protein HELRODRAFT_164480 [Helobdella robusta]|uniref:Fe2OG dioxygenase domain-containing protein n=1 Tax=Helobdella robusta TaxID=6412 RepID=T1EVH4_HELRO|nr:hypothetical protein HELRODRAFT_164480 [Helobdella robusta]ESN94615.1 hypothetical protein HELRODRAFT_164480 [Helobdella robusta]